MLLCVVLLSTNVNLFRLVWKLFWHVFLLFLLLPFQFFSPILTIFVRSSVLRLLFSFEPLFVVLVPVLLFVSTQWQYSTLLLSFLFRVVSFFLPPVCVSPFHQVHSVISMRSFHPLLDFFLTILVLFVIQSLFPCLPFF